MSPSPWCEPPSAEYGGQPPKGARGLASTAPSRLVIVPGLRGSGEGHWQTWLEGQFDETVRVEQDDWAAPDLVRWSRRIVETVGALGPGPHAIVAHSFGCLAGAHALAAGLPVAHALLVAPAEPARFGLDHALPWTALPVRSLVVVSDTDPWMNAGRARLWARRWGSDCISLGDAGHVNVASGFGPFPLARDWAAYALRGLPARRSPVGALHRGAPRRSFAPARG